MRVMRYRGLFVICTLFLAIVPFGVNAAGPAYKGIDDICLTQDVALDKGKLTVKENKGTSTYQECDKARRLGGCTRDAIRDGKCPCGTITFTNTAGGRCPRLTKCRSDYKQLFNSCLRQAGLSPDEIDLSPEDQSPSSGGELPEGVNDVLSGAFDFETAQGRQQAVEALQNAGMDKGDAINAIDKLASGDEAKAKEATELISSKLDLDRRLLEERRLAPPGKGEEEEPGDEGKEGVYSRDTFDQPSEAAGDPRLNDAKKGIACLESSCGNYNAVGPRVCNKRGCGSAYGKYQVMWFNIPSWTARSCGRTIYNPQEFVADTACQEQVFETMFTQFAASCGSYAGAASVWHSGSCTPRPGSNDGYMSTARYVQKFTCYLDGQCQTPAYADGYRGPGGRSSPFAGANPFVSSSAGGYGASASAQPSAGYTQAPQQQYAQQQPPRPPVPVSSQILPPGTQTGVSGSLPPAPTQPEASIIVQPKEIVRGNPLVVSWSTVGMSAANVCQIYLQAGGTTSLFVRGNEGSRTFTTSATSTPGTWEFRLQCSSPAGAAFERIASVVVK